mgnify:CR=1 FL=1
MIERFNENELRSLARQDLNEAIKKVNKQKQQVQQQMNRANMTMTGQKAEFVNLEPNKPDMLGGGLGR